MGGLWVGREDGFGKGLWFKGGGWFFFLEKASTYASSPLLFLCCFVWSCSFLHTEKRLHNSICLGTAEAYFVVYSLVGHC